MCAVTCSLPFNFWEMTIVVSSFCRNCEKKGGRSLRHAWSSLLLWLGSALLALFALVAVLAWWARSR